MFSVLFLIRPCHNKLNSDSSGIESYICVSMLHVFLDPLLCPVCDIMILDPMIRSWLIYCNDSGMQ